MTTGIVRDQNLEKQMQKQMGCMSGFLQIFDRHQILTGKRIHSAKRLRLPPASDSSPEPEKHIGSPAISTPSPAREAQPEAKVTLPVLEFKEGTRSSWKFSREAPRLSLDSRAVVDAKGALHPREIRTNTATATATNLGAENDGDKQRRSTSVIVRLMGLDTLPDSDPDPVAKLRRSASESESRVPRDLPQCRFFDSNNFQLKQLQAKTKTQASNVARENNAGTFNNRLSNDRAMDQTEATRASLPLRQRGIIAQKKKSFYDSADFFPEPKHTVSMYGEIERRLRIRGIQEPPKDPHTLKHILEALQLKGLLHSNQSPIVIMKPVRSSGSLNRTGNNYSSPPPSSLRSSPRARRSPSLASETDRSIRTQTRGRNSRKVQNTETQRKVNSDGVDSRRVSPVHSPKISSRGNAAVQQVTNGSPRARKAIDRKEVKEKVKMLNGAEDESSTISENSFSTSSHTDTERYKPEEYKEGRNLLDRCDKLLNSIAEITAGNELQQPSPVSVLDSSFYKDDWCSPSPITKRCIDYKDQGAESEDDTWSAALCSSEGKSEEAASEDCDFVYVSEILRACSYLPEDSDVFLLLEKHQCLKGMDTSEPSRLKRRLIFDTLQEILNRNQQLPPWKVVSCGEQTQHVWSEFRRIREREESESESEDLFKVICGVLRKDMAEEMSGWGEWTMEMGDVVLDIERLVFKDLIGETIRELASCAPKCNTLSVPRRKLLF
ncbi:protein LONGIFOLIA 1-like [Gastrolobium bilobum]|uniref:protein LONGIFOLIA 1-like n=1 Tax=Gastrolobium bilobum TaxID=150636 RepID=UPI002AAF4609|nr:protein LONGIFOLIA 1-like [Gastrolobium bilobum]